MVRGWVILLEEDPGECPRCSEPFHWIRPGKSQPTCECMLDCERHGKGKIEYHEFGVVKGIAGWYCLDCWSFKDLRRKEK